MAKKKKKFVDDGTPAVKKKTFTVDYSLCASGSIDIEAESKDDAHDVVMDTDTATLVSGCDFTGSIEIDEIKEAD
jgi:hypothetical protein